MIKFTPEQAAQNGKAVEAFLLGKPIQWYSKALNQWVNASGIGAIVCDLHRPAPEPEPAPFWSRIEDVPLNAWMRREGQETLYLITKIAIDGPETEKEGVFWSELPDWLYTTGARDSTGALVFRECRVEAKP